MPSFHCSRLAFANVLAVVALTATGPESLSASRIVPLGADTVVAAGDALFSDIDVAIAGDSSILAVWTERPLLGGAGVIMARHFAADGRPSGEAFAVSDPAAAATQARVQHDPVNDGFVVVWNADLDPARLLGQRLDAGGSQNGPPFEIARPIKIVRDGFDFTIDPSGQLFAVWISLTPLSDIFGTLLNPAGLPSGQFQISNLQTRSSMPSVSAIATDFFIVGWRTTNGALRTRTVRGGNLAASAGSVFQIDLSASAPRFMRPGGESLLWAGEGLELDSIMLSTLGASNPLPIELFTSGFLNLSTPVGAFGVDGSSLFAWSAGSRSSNGSSSPSDIWGLSFDQATAIRLNTTTGGSRERPAIATDGDRRFAIGWKERGVVGERVIMRRIALLDSTCVAREDLACVQGGRFGVEVDWEDSRGRTGRGKAIPFATDKSALFAFFDIDNWEVQIKMLNGCAENGHRWVFASATTNLGYTLTVTDLVTDAVVTYTNPVGTLAPAIADTRAFACQ